MKLIGSILLFCFLLSSCVESEYSRLVKAELAKEVRQDSILLTIQFGDAQSDFFQKCMQLNKQKLVMQGPNNSSVQYVFYDSAFHNDPASIRLLFYPRYDKNNVINRMDLEFSYSGWAPWNRKFQSDRLQVKVLDILQSWYGGNEFINVEIDEKLYPLKVDGNRRMLVYIKDSESVVVIIQDILHPDYKHSISK